MNNIQFGRSLYVMDRNMGGDAANLVHHYRTNKGIQAAVLPINYQQFVVTGNTVNQAQAISDRYVKKVAPLFDELVRVALPKPLSAREFQTDWATIGTGPQGFPNSDQFGVVAIARKIEAAARQAQEQMRELVRTTRPAVWKFNEMRNGKVYGEIYKGPLKQPLLDAALNPKANWDQIRQDVDPMQLKISNQLWQARQARLDQQA